MQFGCLELLLATLKLSVSKSRQKDKSKNIINNEGREVCWGRLAFPAMAVFWVHWALEIILFIQPHKSFHSLGYKTL